MVPSEKYEVMIVVF